MFTPRTGLIAPTLVTPSLPTGTTDLSVDSTALPYVVQTEAVYSQIEISIYNQKLENYTPVTVTDGVQFSGTLTLDPSLGDTSIQIVAYNYNPQQITWNPSTAYALNYRLVDSNGYVQVATTSGVSGTSVTWNTTVGGTTTDGTVVWTNVGFIQISPSLKFNLIAHESDLGVIIAPPSAVRSYKSQNVCRIEWQQPTYPGTLGTRVMLSTDPAGVQPIFIQYGDLVPTSAVSRTELVVVASTTETSYDTTTGKRITTTTDTTESVNYNYIDIPSSAVNGAQVFYAMLSTVVQDSTTNAVFESQQNGPLACGFINLKLVNPTDFLALQRKEDVSARLISQMTRYYPTLDLSPRSELRDLLVDPVSIELSNMSVREWFARVSQSVSAMAQIDDSDGDGFSDPYNSSAIKQQISRAFGLSASDTQSLIDRQFDILGEQTGVSRLGATGSVVTLTFYTYVKPTASVSFPQGVICSTVPDSQTPSVSFVTTGSASLTLASVNSFYDPINGWWAVSVPASCQSTGSITNVGAGTVRSASTGVPSGWNVTNLVAAAFGQDDEINSKFAARIQNRAVTGVDSGTRGGYLSTALATPGVVSAMVVAAGDTEMLRDWDNVRQKHVYGCVDIYARGTSFSEQDEIVAYTYQNSATYGAPSNYQTLRLIDTNSLKFQIVDFKNLTYPLYQGLALMASRVSGGSIYFGLERAQFDNNHGYVILNPNDMAYQIVGDTLTQAYVPVLISGVAATNKVALSYLGNNATYQFIARLHSPLMNAPALQPIVGVNSVSGQSDMTGSVPLSMAKLVHTSDFLLYGGSNQAADMVEVPSTTSQLTQATVVARVNSYVTIDSDMDIVVDTNGVPGDVLSVLSEDQTIAYGKGVDYDIAVTGAFHSYGIKPRTVSYIITNVQLTNNVLTITTNNKFSRGAQVLVSGLAGAAFLNGQTVTVSDATPTQFTAYYEHLDYLSTPDNGQATGTSILDNQTLLVSYNKFYLREQLAFVNSETQQLNGTVPAVLKHQGFVHNTWLPENHGNYTLTLDGWGGNYVTDSAQNIIGLDVSTSTGLVGALIPHDSRYIKVTYNGTVMREGVDFVLVVDDATGTAAISRNVTNLAASRIPDGGVVQVSYFYVEAFTISTEYPAFVELLANTLKDTKHAAADVLVKAMVANPVDITMTVVLEPNVSADTVDPVIRTVIDRVLDNASGTLYQSEVVRQVKAITGVQSVVLPLAKCAKSDGSYTIGEVIPSGTVWAPLSTDPYMITQKFVTPANSFITTTSVLSDSTLPSGGNADAFVGLLYEGQAYTRCLSVQEFLKATSPETSTQSGYFYICGGSDPLLDNPANTATDYLSYAYSGKVMICVPQDVKTPSVNSYLVTYQVYNEGTAKDITLSSTEYVSPGRVTINYVTGS